ncbi:MAG: Flp pilus assembly complex ATPase component TadA [Thermoproteales archaeon]|nr:Flp pilus assembly complex ATPase component TadA [Thermoproteales archaeon]
MYVIEKPPKDHILVEEYEVSRYARVAIVRTPRGSYKYYVLEEELSDEELEALSRVVEKLRYALAKAEGGEEELARRMAEEEARRRGVDAGKLLYYLERDYLGYGPIHALMLDPNLEDISCNGVGVPVYVWHARYGSLETNITFTDLEWLKSYIRSMAAKCGKHISSAFPILDATLPNGYRLAATLEDVSSRGPTFTIRKFKERPITIIEQLRDNVICPELAAFFWLMIENKRTFMIFGATGSGKTTLLNALLTFLPPDMKVCTVEETREINLPIKNWVPLVSRESYALGESVGSVSLYDLVKVTLRYRPDYVIVGEVRGEEAYVLFQAMQSGHGGVSTMHAESLRGLINRLLNPPMNIPPQLIPTLNFAMHISRVRRGGRILRRVLGVWEIRDVEDFEELARWDPRTDSFVLRLERSRILETVAEANGLTKEEALEEVRRRAKLLRYLAENGIVEYDEIVKWVYEYYRDPQAVVERIEAEARQGKPVPVSVPAAQRGEERRLGPLEAMQMQLDMLHRRLEEMRARRRRKRSEVRVDILGKLRAVRR